MLNKIKENIKNLLIKQKTFLQNKLEKPKNFILKILSKLINFLKRLIIILKFPQIYKFLKLDILYNKLQSNKYINKIFNKEGRKKILLLILIPILIFLYCQTLCFGKYIFEISRMLLNFILIYLIIGFTYCLIGKLKPSIYISIILTFIIGIIDYFITSFRGTPLVPWDIFSINVALTVLPTFKFTLTKRLAFGIFLFILSLIIAKKIKFKSYRNHPLKITYRFIILVFTIIFFYNFYFTSMINAFYLDENWDPKEEYHNNGLIASLFKQSRNLIISQPEGYNVESLSELSSEITANIVEHDEDYETPNIIMIMNESFSDLSVIGDFTTNEDYMPYFHSLSGSNVIKGNLHVSVFGAQTPNTEWEVLTSNSMAFVPKRTIPYQQYVLRNSYSLASILKEQGYSTIAMHSYYPQGYNRNITYPRLGFDLFYHIYTMSDLSYIRDYPSDKSTYQNIISLYENKAEDEKLFNFTLTMQNHGSYTDENFESTIIANNGEYPKLNQYLSLIKIADNSLEELINYFSKQEEHTILVLFGDHQPYVEDEFYDSLLSQRYEDITSKEAVENKYITPFLIWANYDIHSENYQDITDISTNYLTSLVLDVAGIQKTAYLQFLDELKEEIPIITGNGYIDKNNIYHDFDEENEYTELINNYHYLQFNNMFDNSSKLTHLFETPKKEIENEIQEVIEEDIIEEINEDSNIVSTETITEDSLQPENVIK